MHTHRQYLKPLTLTAALAVCCVMTEVGLADIRPLDSTITRRVKEKVKHDFLLREADLTVKTIAGNVRIEGQVSSVLHKYRLQRLLKDVDGVRRVTTRLEVRPLYARDSELERGVTRALNYDPILRSSRPAVRIQNQVVTLNGVVTGLTEKHHAERLARNVRGVRSVRNNLTLEPLALANARHDVAIEDEIHIALQKDSELSRLPIFVNVQRGVIHLTGEVDTKAQQLRAEELAFHVRGVEHVDNRLVIVPFRGTADNAHRIDRDAEAKLAHDVNVKIQSDPRIDAARIVTGRLNEATERRLKTGH